MSNFKFHRHNPPLIVTLFNGQKVLAVSVMEVPNIMGSGFSGNAACVTPQLQRIWWSDSELSGPIISDVPGLSDLPTCTVAQHIAGRPFNHS